MNGEKKNQIEKQKAEHVINHFESHLIQNDECRKSTQRQKIQDR